MHLPTILSGPFPHGLTRWEARSHRDDQGAKFIAAYAHTPPERGL
ncbi:hypothetical protein [Microvirga arabica]|nr:hypothetical protein [Microvirga arabica]